MRLENAVNVQLFLPVNLAFTSCSKHVSLPTTTRPVPESEPVSSPEGVHVHGDGVRLRYGVTLATLGW